MTWILLVTVYSTTHTQKSSTAGFVFAYSGPRSWLSDGCCHQGACVCHCLVLGVDRAMGEEEVATTRGISLPLAESSSTTTAQRCRLGARITIGERWFPTPNPTPSDILLP